MLIQKKVINNVAGYSLYKAGNFTHLTSNDILDPELNIIGTGTDFLVGQKYLFWNTDEGAVAYDLQGKLKTVFPEISIFKNSVSSYHFYGRKKDYDGKIYFVDVSQKEERLILENYQWGKIIETSSGGLIVCSEGFIKSFLNKTISWQISVASLGKIEKLLGISDNNLWITTTDFNEKTYTITRRLLAVNINTGTVEKEYDNSKEKLSYGTELLQERKQIISFSAEHQTRKTYYTVIDAETGTEVESVEIITLFNRGYKNAQTFTIHNNRAYFITNEFHTITCSAFGIFNLETKELEFLEKVPLKKGHLNQAPQTDGNKVYILDSAGTLHIYEPGDLKTSIDFDEKEIEPKVEEVKISIQEAYNNCVGKVDRIDTSQIDYFKNSTSAFYYIETDYNFKESVLITLASISTLLGDSYKLSVRDYIHDNDKSFVNVNINGTALQLELPVNHEFNDFILEPINSYLLQQGELRKIKMVEPLPAEEGIIISFLEDEEFKNCVANGFGYGINQEF